MARSVVSSPLCPFFSLLIYSMDYTTVASNILCYRLTGKHTASGEKIFLHSSSSPGSALKHSLK